MRSFDEAAVRAALRQAWSLETAKQWTPDCPAAGQCNVTAVVIHDLYGGEILQTALSDVVHFYNRVAGRVVDLTDSQFTSPITYDDAPATRTEAMACVRGSEYAVLRAALSRLLGGRQF